MEPLLFLDIDGVLNTPESYAPGRALIEPACARQLQRVIDATGARLVLSSAWRYQILRGAVTLQGFQHLLRSHGIRAHVLGTTGRDARDTQQEYDGRTGPQERARQIRSWLADCPEAPLPRWAVVDDAKLSLADPELPIVETDGGVGLTPADADRLITLLRRKGA